MHNVMNRVFKSIVIIGFLLLCPLTYATAATYTVTQNGSGANYSASTFNALSGNKAGTTYYFSGTFTTRLTPNIYGTSGNEVILDGYQAGDCDPLSGLDQCTSSAVLNRGMAPGTSTAYCKIQDFRITDSVFEKAVILGSINHIIFQRNQIKDTSAGNFQPRGSYFIIRQNRFSGFNRTYNDPENVNLNHLDHSLFQQNIIAEPNGALNNATSSNLSAMHNNNNVLWEYNNVYAENMSTSNIPCASLAIKESANNGTTPNTNIVVRFNKWMDNNATSSSIGLALEAGRDSDDYIYVYGNLFANNGFGARSGDGGTYHYFWSNVFTGNAYAGYYNWGRDPPQGSLNHIYLYNNTFSTNRTNDSGGDKGSIELLVGSNLFAKNNIVYYTHSTVKSQIFSSASSTLDYDTVWHPLGNSSSTYWYYGSGYRGLAKMQDTYSQEQHGDARDPLLTDPDGADNIVGTDDDNVTLKATSPEIGTGVDLSQQFQVDLSGGDSWFEANSGYGRYITMNLADALDPNNTDWTKTPPKVKTVKQGNYGAWERGAYAYTGASDTVAPPAPSVRIEP